MGWALPGSTELEKHIFLDRLTKQLSASGHAVGWNSEWQNWDLKIRRGALGEVLLRMVVEYHGGPRRMARLSATIRPLRFFYWVQGAMAAFGTVMGVLGLPVPYLLSLGLFALLWIACTSEANRLESGVVCASTEVVRQLELERRNVR